MPVDVVDIDLTTTSATIPQTTFGTVGTVTVVEKRPENVELIERYNDPTDVTADFGEKSKAHKASQALSEMGVRFWYVISLLSESGSVDKGSAQEGTVSDAPLSVNSPVTGATVAGEAEADTEVMYTAKSPTTDMAKDRLNGDKFKEGLLVNAYSGEWSATNTGVTFNYTSTDHQPIEERMQSDIDLLNLAGIHVGLKEYGEFKWLTQFAVNQQCAVVGAYSDGSQVDKVQNYLEEVWEIGGGLQQEDKKCALTFAHKSSADVGSYVLGQLAINPAWFDPFYDGDGYPFSTAYFEDSLVGGPLRKSTFEGGNSKGVGNTNVIINVDGVDVLSNSLTPAGTDSAYTYIDVYRTEILVENVIKEALKNLRLSQDKIPYTDTGREQILAAVDSRLAELEGNSDSPISSYELRLPLVSEVSQAKRSSRIYPGLKVNVTLAGNVHTFQVKLNLKV